jgi:hypothetical protein
VLARLQTLHAEVRTVSVEDLVAGVTTSRKRHLLVEGSGQIPVPP